MQKKGAMKKEGQKGFYHTRLTGASMRDDTRAKFNGWSLVLLLGHEIEPCMVKPAPKQ